MKGIERVKGAQSKPNPSPDAFPKFCKWFSGRFLLKGRGTRTVPSLREKSSLNLPKRKEGLNTKIITRNYEGKLLQEIITGNYEWKLSARILSRKDYRDTGVSKKHTIYQQF